MIDLLLKLYDKLVYGYKTMQNALVKDERIFTKESAAIVAKREAAIAKLGDRSLLKGGSWNINPKVLQKDPI